MRTRREIGQIVGKTITGVVIKHNPRPPMSQVFLIFSDETSYEFYSDDIGVAGGVDKGGIEAVRNCTMPGGIIALEALLQQSVNVRDYPDK